jgi:heterodisulfide reductase subunit C
MDFTPRQLWRLLLLGCKDDIFESNTFALCSACYYCTLRCPRGLPLTEAMAALKQIAAQEDLPAYKQSTLFYKSFMESVRRHGRVREMEFMTLYFWAMKSPLMPLKFAPLGVRLMAKKKLPLHVPSGGRGEGRLAAIFRKAETGEGA